MDPASAILGIVAFGLTVMGGIKKLRSLMSDVPKNLQSLFDDASHVEAVMKYIQQMHEAGSLTPGSASNAMSLSVKDQVQLAKKILEDIQCFLDENGFGNSSDTARRLRMLSAARMLIRRGHLKELQKNLGTLRAAFDTIIITSIQ